MTADPQEKGRQKQAIMIRFKNHDLNVTKVELLHTDRYLRQMSNCDLQSDDRIIGAWRK